jgi:hypothetical protein
MNLGIRHREFLPKHRRVECALRAMRGNPDNDAAGKP